MSLGKISVNKHCFCYSNVSTTGTKNPFVPTANEGLLGTLMTIGDVTDIFPITAKIITLKLFQYMKFKAFITSYVQISTAFGASIER